MHVLAGVFLGWSLGSNDAANVFGTAVSSKMVRWRTAAILLSVFALLGALLQGGDGLETYSKLSNQTLTSAFCVALAAALTTAAMTVVSIPVSTSQAVVGGILGIALYRIHLGQATVKSIDLGSLGKVVLCWIGTPIGSMIAALILYPLAARILRALNLHFLVYDHVMRILLVGAGMYGAYALGANNVANVTGVFYKAGAFDAWPLSPKFMALLVGGASIGFGALTYSRHVMMTVGSKLVPLDAFSAFIVVLAQAITVHIYAEVGVPVSTSQAVVGAVLGIGILKGLRTVSFKTLGKILIGWILTPFLGIGVTYLLALGLM